MRTRSAALLPLLLFAATAPARAGFISLDGTSGPSSLELSFVYTNTETTAQTITVTVSDTSFLVPTGSALAQLTASGVFTGGSGSVEVDGYIDLSNSVLGTGTLVDSTTSLPYTGPLTPMTIPGPYALVVYVPFTLDAGATLTLDALLNVVPATAPVPEPATCLLVAAGCAGLAGCRRLRRGGKR